MAPSSGTTNKSAKEFLDEIGEEIYKKVHGAAKQYYSELHGDLSFASIFDTETRYTTDPCGLINNNRDKLAARGDPCGSASDKRFSKERVDEYDEKKIKDNKGNRGNNEGECAPYRRLSLCNKNMEKKGTTKITDKNDLLAEVCLAANHEGNSIKTHLIRYDATYPGSAHTTCTALARSFADIGDIIRGKDLYGGSKKEKEKREDLEKNLKTIFKKIHGGLTNGAEARYKDDEDKNYYQLREDWWALNRKEVWKAMTCSDDDNKLAGASYFRPTCIDRNEKGPSVAQKQCRCDKDKGAKDDNQVPTYFDYVPQYLRWFEEWAEDFCRKKKKKLPHVETNCRGQFDNKPRYCSRNGSDCEETISRIGKVRLGKGCTDCFFACHSYENWIDNQRKQFLKQKEKCENEREGKVRQKRDMSTNYEGYDKKFYDELKKGKYGTVNAFLDLLNKEKECQHIDDKGGKINFAEDLNDTSNEYKGTFYHSEYCKPCPDCGVKLEGNGKFKDKDKSQEKCEGEKLYEPKSDDVGTPITILKSGVNHDDIETKLKAFCAQTNRGTTNAASGDNSDNATTGYCGTNNSDSSLCEPWKCYEAKHVQKVKNGEDDDDDVSEVRNAGGLCILKKKNEKNDANSQNNHADIQKTFHDFFYYWVAHMLKDSIHWRTRRLRKCINDGTTMKCINGCNTKCECFKRWVEQKKEEWKPIKDHFKTQEGIPEGGYFITLEGNLELEFLKKDSTEDSEQDSQSRDEDAKETKRIKDMFDKKAKPKKIDDTSNEETIIDFMLEEELKDATECIKKCQDTAPKPTAEDPGRPHSETGTGADEDDEDDDDDEDDEEEEGDEGEESSTQQDTKQVEEKATTTQDKVNPCEIVDDLFKKPGSLNAACEQKYSEPNRYWGWRCVAPSDTTKTSEGGENGRARRDTDSSGEPTSGKSDTGSICVPPRRRRLYIHKVDDGEFDDDKSLRDWFVKSAAVETFFLWHKYKMDKKREEKEKQEAQGKVHELKDDKDEAQNSLERGEIPEDFKRQMFYTLGDYRDICVGKTPDGIDKVSASGDNTMKKINDKIKENLSKQPGTPTVHQNSGTTPSSWWDENAKHIWKGMVCALTYKYDENSKKIEKDGAVYEKFFGTPNGKPLPQPGKPGTYKEKYDYTNVSFSGGFNSDKNAATITTKLEEFSRRPTYFRWLEEWGEEFCHKQKHKLYIIEKDCMYDTGGKKCSGDGLKCNEIVIDKEKIFEDFLCPTCARHCRFYKKWIRRKKDEYEEQKKAYGEQQKEKCKTESNGAAPNNGGDNGFCGTVTTSTTAAEFLQKLGSCKKDNKDNENGKGKTIFDDDSETFKHTKHCDPCSEFTVKCSGNNHCDNSNGNNCKDNKITAEKIAKLSDSTVLDMRVSDNNTTGFNGLEACKNAHIFEGIRKDVWKCGTVCGVHICKRENEGDEKYITMKELLKRWLEYFFEDYNRIQKKLKLCTKKEDGSTCIKGCVDEWIKLKKEEWKKIKDTYLDKYTKENPEGNNLKTFLEELIPRMDLVNDNGKINDLSTYLRSYACKCNDNSEKKGGTPKDIVECLLKKLEDKAKECKEYQKPNGEKQANCGEYTSPDDEEDLTLEETEENTVEQPKFCPTVEEPKETEEGEEKCEPEPAPPKDTEADSEQNPRQTPIPKPVGPTPPAPAPAAPPSPSLPPVREPFDPTILQTTIPLGIALALGSIAFLFLKKKTKSSVDLIRVLDIHKSDYNIPTKLSPNRYIPYTSGKYRGKRYIYLEGDSGTDSGYTDHYSDITSSSESEYEELDINDIYAPRAPKYKTLIEVVLEPSGKLSGNTIPTSGNNTTASDNTPTNKFADNEWNTLKDEFISQYLQSEQPNDVPNDYTSGNSSTNTNITTTSRHNMDQKPFIMSIHDRNLYTGEEYNYNVNMSTNSMDDIPINRDNNVYSGIDLINDSLNGEPIDIYDELLKRKENELFGTNHPKRTSIHSVAKPTRDDPLHNQLELFHKWLDRHRDMCEKWNNKEEVLDKLKEEWENETHSGNTHPSGNTPPTSDIPSGKQSDIPSDNNIHSDIPYVLNTDVSIQIHMDNPKPINEFTNMDTILEDLDKYNEPYYDVQDDIYYDVNDNDQPSVYSNAMDIPSKVQIEMDVNTKLVKEKYPIADVWDI
ncbi:erythrocyte membrane protein 1 [Plasmodium falciparum IGH-CR14]|uniref:Erythrocyte membrane protein 1 n=1 Tax=Plasmodium falciparum IGH-CR14 TaxID=580059 RepID=A0A0L1I411_PLAFA|nr:erythrocyte membrane protein 1 [Plasmodium falciparum IGH-CR14]